MGSVLSGIFGASNDYTADTNGQNYQRDLEQTHDALNANLSNQNSLNTMLLANANGQGANPAQEMLKRQTDINNQKNAGFIASQKGINPALAARLAAQNASTSNADAASQGAVLQAQQQLAAQGQLGNLYGQVGNQQLQRQQNFMGAQQGTNVVNAGVSNQNTQTAGQLGGGLLNAAGGIISAGIKAAPAVVAPVAAAALSKGGTVKKTQKVLVSPGELIKVPGKAKVSGDSEENDIVPMNLPAGTKVVPRSKASDDSKTKSFLKELASKNKVPDGDESGYAIIIQLKKRLAAIEKKVGKK